jgi:hypothetical protein
MSASCQSREIFIDRKRGCFAIRPIDLALVGLRNALRCYSAGSPRAVLGLRYEDRDAFGAQLGALARSPNIRFTNATSRRFVVLIFATFFDAEP